MFDLGISSITLEKMPFSIIDEAYMWTVNFRDGEVRYMKARWS